MPLKRYGADIWFSINFLECRKELTYNDEGYSLKEIKFVPDSESYIVLDRRTKTLSLPIEYFYSDNEYIQGGVLSALNIYAFLEIAEENSKLVFILCDYDTEEQPAYALCDDREVAELMQKEIVWADGRAPLAVIKR